MRRVRRAMGWAEFLTTVAVVYAVVLAAVPLADASDRFPLTKVVPSDVFVLEAGMHVPEQDFINAHWNEVWVEFEKSGIANDLLKLVKNAMDDESRAEFERVYDRFGQVCGAIDWSALGSGEYVFAERMDAVEIRGTNVSIGMPDMIVAFRHKDGDASGNYAGFVQMLETSIEEINKLGELSLKLDKSSKGDLHMTEFNITQMLDDGPVLAISVTQYKDVLVFAMGDDLRDEMLAMLRGAEGESIVDTPRYKAAMAELPTPQSGLVYFDMPNLKGQLQQISDAIFNAIDEEEGVGGTVADHPTPPEIFAKIEASLAAYEDKDYAEALKLTKEAYAIDARHPVVLYNLACFHALTGSKDEALGWLEKAAAGGFRDLAKIKSDSDLASLRSDARYTAVIQDLAGSDEVSVASGIQGAVNRLLESMLVMDSSATVYRTEGTATYSDTVTLLAANASDNPIYPVISGHKRIKDWHKYLPVETTDFTVSAGISLDALYTYAKGLFEAAGEPGQYAWSEWESFLKDNDFSVERDILAWLDTASISVNFEYEGTDAWALLMKVRDEKMAGEKLVQGIDMAGELLQEMSQEIPPLAMLAMEVEPTAGMDGFHDLMFAIAPEPMVVGVRDGWIMLASSQGALETVLATADGSHDNVTRNGFIVDRSLMPKGAIETISFADHRGDAEMMGQVLSGLSGMGGMVAAMIPEPEAREMIGPVFGMISRLGPVVAKMNFFEATAGTVEFDGKVYRQRSVTHYVAAH